MIGSICVNNDITKTVQMEGFLRQFNQYDVHQEEVFANDINSLLEYLIAQGSSAIGKQPAEMNKAERIRFVAFLDSKGAFMITHSSERICKLLGVSKFTFYSYLEAARNQAGEKDDSSEDNAAFFVNISTPALADEYAAP